MRRSTHALELASELGDNVVVGYGYEPQRGPGGEYKAPPRRAQAMGEEATAEARRQAQGCGTSSRRSSRGPPAPGLAELAAERDARFIVVGSYGESPLRSAILGSTPHKLLAISEVPVLVGAAAAE